jgi:hypothetical protein
MKCAVAALGPFLLLAPSALAADSSPLTPGFWAFPQSKEIVGDALADSCSTGFSIYFADGSMMSFLVETSGDKPTLINDGEGTCTFDAARNASICIHRDWWDGVWTETKSEVTYTIEADGRLRYDYVGGGNSLTTYPLPCPESGVREALRFLAPK